MVLVVVAQAGEIAAVAVLEGFAQEQVYPLPPEQLTRLLWVLVAQHKHLPVLEITEVTPCFQLLPQRVVVVAQEMRLMLVVEDRVVVQEMLEPPGQVTHLL